MFVSLNVLELFFFLVSPTLIWHLTRLYKNNNNLIG